MSSRKKVLLKVIILGDSGYVRALAVLARRDAVEVQEECARGC